MRMAASWLRSNRIHRIQGRDTIELASAGGLSSVASEPINLDEALLRSTAGSDKNARVTQFSPDMATLIQGLDGGDRGRSTINRAVDRAADNQLHWRYGSDRLFAYITNLHQLDGRDLIRVSVIGQSC